MQSERYFEHEVAGTVEWRIACERYEWAREFVAPGSSVLDAACGSGYGSQILAEVGADVIGADISAAAIEYARKRYSLPTFAKSDLDTVPYIERATFDTICSIETIEHLQMPWAFLEWARKTARRRIILSTPVIPSKASNHYHLHDFTREQIEEEMVARGGWKLVEFRLHRETAGFWVFDR